MNILEIANLYVCPAASLPQFDSLMSNSDTTAKDIQAALRMAGEEIIRRAEWQALRSSAVITAGSQTYTIPDDFHRLISGNAVTMSATPFTPIPCITSYDVWAMIAVNPSSQPYFTIRNGFLLLSTVTAVDVEINYISNQWITQMPDSTASNEFSTDEDEVKISAQLLGIGALYRYKRMKRLEYQDVQEEFEAMFDIELKADRGIT